MYMVRDIDAGWRRKIAYFYVLCMIMIEPERNIINDDMRRTCFFCSELIKDKKTQEHIIPNSLLGKLGIKEDSVTSKNVFQYSRVKVPAHESCNNTFGSKYESKIIKLLDEPEKLFEELKNEDYGVSTRYSPDSSSTSLISTWLSKIYYGLFYNDYLKTNDLEYKNIAERIINTESSLLPDFRNFLLSEERSNDKFPLHLYALAEIMALKMCIPKKTSFIYSNETIMNMSLSTSVKNPNEYYKVNEELIEQTRNQILEDFNVKIK